MTKRLGDERDRDIAAACDCCGRYNESLSTLAARYRISSERVRQIRAREQRRARQHAEAIA